MSTTDVTMGDYGERLARVEVTLGSYGERLSGIEITLSHMATSAQVQKMMTEVSILKWPLGTVAATVLYAAVKYLLS